MGSPNKVSLRDLGILGIQGYQEWIDFRIHSYKAARQYIGTVTQRICCHLARLKDWNHNGFPPAGGQAMLLPNFVE
ncbi:hypothetical protein TNCV_2083011 [Trichonephila clavipes]|nr:hypothetical protein TNCV_2083011 [Trichonephila clavipes]